MFLATGDGKESALSSSSSSLQGSQPCRHFRFPEIQLATHDFDESLVIGHGGFGKVYKGNVINGSTPVSAAIKRLDSTSSQGAAEFWAEVEMLSKLRHCNLVSLIGYCNHGKEMILVYEYMPNGTLEDHLHKLGTPLSWVQRLKICIGAGRGLHYLHTGTGIEVGVIHRDVKSSNILLHESWAAKISDFGLSRIGPTNKPSTYVKTVVKGTFGYLDPDYFYTGKLTRKSDVYAFGVVLLEVLCRKRAVDRSLDEEQWNLARWAQESIEEGNLKHIIDPDIRGQISPKCLKTFVRITEGCLHSNSKQRSTMAEVVVSLESVLTLQEKFNDSLQSAGRTIFGRMIDMFPFSSKGENSAQGDSKLSSNTKGNSTSVGNTLGADHNMFLDNRELPADSNIQSFKEFKFSDLERTTSNFSQNLLMGKGGFGGLFLGWVDKNTFTPSRRGLYSSISAQGDSKLSSNTKGNSTSVGNTLGADHNMFLDNRELPADSNIQSFKEFKFSDLERTTSNFSQNLLMGKGGFGGLFLGWVDKNTFTPSRRGIGIAVAVKRIKQASSEGRNLWLAMANVLGPAHPNIISLLGYCNEKEDEYLLVYEYMQNRSFGHFLFSEVPDIVRPLSWGTRISIMIGVARGLTYLHQLKDQIILRGVKSSNILLDEDFNAKLTNFELATCGLEIGRAGVTRRVMGSLDYLDPNYSRIGLLSMKSDIYSFGEVLLEMLTGLRGVDFNRPEGQQNLVCWASSILVHKELKKIIDPRLEQNYPEEGAFKCAALALRCLADEPTNRPSSDELLWNLEQIYAVNK